MVQRKRGSQSFEWLGLIKGTVHTMTTKRTSIYTKAQGYNGVKADLGVEKSFGEGRNRGRENVWGTRGERKKKGAQYRETKIQQPSGGWVGWIRPRG